MWGIGLRFRGRANNSLITGRFHEGGHVCALSPPRNGSMSFLVVPERMPMCFTLYIVSFPPARERDCIRSHRVCLSYGALCAKTVGRVSLTWARAARAGRVPVI